MFMSVMVPLLYRYYNFNDIIFLSVLYVSYLLLLRLLVVITSKTFSLETCSDLI